MDLKTGFLIFYLFGGIVVLIGAIITLVVSKNK